MTPARGVSQGMPSRRICQKNECKGRTSRPSACEENEALAEYCAVPAGECQSSAMESTQKILVACEVTPGACSAARTHCDFGIQMSSGDSSIMCFRSGL
jgi:hypothetical protein